MNHIELGKIGENIACGYLVNNKYEIIDRNYREKIGEIDVITKSPDKTLVFIEVKTISIPKSSVEKSPASYPHLAGLRYEQDNDFIYPEDQMSASKINKFKRICQWYANSHPKLVNNKGYQLDAITILLDNNKKSYFINHYKNI